MRCSQRLQKVMKNNPGVIAIPEKIYTVEKLNRFIKNLFETEPALRLVTVQGEVGNVTYHSSGHIYFTLKDEKSQIPAVMFAGDRGGLSFKIERGAQIVVTGSVNVFERDGRYQLYSKRIKKAGTGLLYEQYEALKRELSELGMFSEEYKQPIPKYIKTLGVVTAPTGAAIRDIIQITRRRNPYVQIILYPAIVQGADCPASVIQGIRALEEYGVDVMIVGRGGGSIEDLWGFNDRNLAQAVFDCSVPIISAVGHEIDTTIIDYVSDLRAPTPSAAAELAVKDISEIDGALTGYFASLNEAMQDKLTDYRDYIAHMHTRLKYLSPANKLREQKSICISSEERLRNAFENVMNKKRHRLELYIESMKGLSPLQKLSSGFSYAEDEKGNNVLSIKALKSGDILNIRMSDGTVVSRVEGIKGIPGAV